MQCGDSVSNAKKLEDTLSGREKGVKCDMVLLNAAAAMACAGLANNLEDGLVKGREVIADGSAFERLRLLKESAK